jgi:hypothetical protein
MKSFKNLTLGVISALSFFLIQSCNKEQNSQIKNRDMAMSAPVIFTPPQLIDMDIDASDRCIYWYRNGTVSVGTSTNSLAYSAKTNFTLPSGLTPSNVVAIGIANNNHCYYWYSNGTVSSGTYSNASAYFSPVPYVVPSNESISNIVSMSIAKVTSSYVYTWYKDGTATVGVSTNLGSIRSNYPYTLPAGETISNIAGIGIAGSNDHTYVWYLNPGGSIYYEYVSSGYTNVFNAYFNPVTASF